MFAYCLNTPVMTYDASGTRCVSTVSSVDDATIINRCEPTELENNVMDKWLKKGVKYKSNGAGKGGRIENSYLITKHQDLYEYSDYLVNKSEYRHDFNGSVEGIVFEWDVHNIIYYFGPAQWEDNARDVDFGRTIFSDSHRGMNMVMWLGFYLTYPEQYYSDLFR